MHVFVDGKHLCHLCNVGYTIHAQRTAAVAGVKIAADKMLQTSKDKFPPVQMGQSVLLPVPEYDRGPLDEPNLLGKVVNIFRGQYMIGTAKGILKTYLLRNGFDVTDVQLTDTIPSVQLSLRELAAKHSVNKGPGKQKCNCTSKTKCDSNRCSCRRLGILCGSRCHGSSSCANKG